jgi:hypothetical protein
LLEQLQKAALEARLELIERLTEQIAAHSAPAAGHLRSLARNFEYDELRMSIKDALKQ